MASAAAERYLATLPPADQEAIRSGGDVDAWFQAAVDAGAVPAQYGGKSNLTEEQRQAQAGNTWQEAIDPGQDVYANRDWSKSPNAAIFDQQYQRLLGMGVAPSRAKRIVSVALGGTEHDWQGGGNTAQGGFRFNDPGDAYYGMSTDDWVNNFLWGDKQFDSECPQEAPFRSEQGGCVEKPWDSGDSRCPGGTQGVYPNCGPKVDGAGGEGGGGGGGRDKGNASTNPGQAQLQQYLTDLYANKQDIFGEANKAGNSLAGGGLVWQDADAPANQPPPAAGQPPVSQPESQPPLNRPESQTPAPTGERGQRGERGPGGINPAYGVAPTGPAPGAGANALISATLNAFTPNAPSATSASPAAQTTAPAATSGYNPGITAPAMPNSTTPGGTWNNQPLPRPATGGVNPNLQASIANKPAWWRQPQVR